MFGKKKKEDSEEDSPEEEEKPEKEPSGSGEMSLGHLTADVEKLKAQFSTFYELSKANTERFTRVNEQIGELRTMMMDKDKETRVLEAKATQAIDLVQTVQPDKLMIEIRKQDAKIEALRANIESNEVVINNAMTEIRNMRSKLQAFSGMEQVIKVNDEVKLELSEIRKTNATISRHADKVETIFTEMQHRFSDFSKFVDNLKDFEKSLRDLTSDFDNIKTKSTNFADKKDVENLLIKFNNFEKQVSSLISLYTKKLEHTEKESQDKFAQKMDRAEKLLNGFEVMAKKVPELDKYFNLLNAEAKKAPKEFTDVEKIKVLGKEEASGEEENEEDEKKGFFSKLKLPKFGGKKEGE